MHGACRAGLLLPLAMQLAALVWLLWPRRFGAGVRPVLCWTAGADEAVR